MTVISDEEKEQMLDELNKIHDPQNAPEDPFGDFPDSIYQTRLDKIYFSKIKDKIKIVIEFEIISGSFIHRTIWKWCNMETSQNLDFLTNDFKRLGIKEFTWTTIEERFPELLDRCYEIELKTNKETKFQNSYIRKEINVNVKQEPKQESGNYKGNTEKLKQSNLFTEPAQEPDDDVPF